MRHIKWLYFFTATCPNITSEPNFSNSLMFSPSCSICCHRDITLPRPSQFWTLKAATSLRSSPGRWDRKSAIYTWPSFLCLSFWVLIFWYFYIYSDIFIICCDCKCKLKLFLMFWRTTTGCWIWWEKSFWLQTWHTTFVFSRTCRRWPIVSPSGSISTATFHLFLFTHNPEQEREAWFRCPQRWHQSGVFILT